MLPIPIPIVNERETAMKKMMMAVGLAAMVAYPPCITKSAMPCSLRGALGTRVLSACLLSHGSQARDKLRLCDDGEVEP